MTRSSIEPETVLVGHDAAEALTRMEREHMAHLCVVDGDVVVGVVARDALARHLEREPETQLHDVMQREVVAMSSHLSGADRRAALRASGAPFALILDDRNQVRGLLERERMTDADPAPETLETHGARRIMLDAKQQSGSTGVAIRVYSERPHVEESQK